MQYELEKLPGEPIVVLTLFADWDARASMTATINDLTELFDSLDEDVYYISHLNPDFSMNLEDMIWTTNEAARGGSAILRHPRIKALLVVAQNRLITMAAQGLKSTTFGKINVTTFDTLEEALDHARVLAGEQSP